MIRTSLILTGSYDDITEVSKQLTIHPCETRTSFPQNSIADPFWYTEVASNCPSVDETIQILIARISKSMNFIMDKCLNSEVEPTIQVLINCSYMNRPEISFSPKSIEFISKIGAELCLDVSYDVTE